MKRWLLGMTLLAALAYFHFVPPPRYVEPADPLNLTRDKVRFKVTFRTFPSCDIYVHHPDSKETFGEPKGRSNTPTYLEPAGGQGTQVYYVYSQRAKEILGEHPTDWVTQEQLEIPSENLRQKDLNWDIWPPSYFPKFLLTTRSAWNTFGRSLLDLALSHWLLVGAGMTTIALSIGHFYQIRRRAQVLAGSTQVGGFLLKESLGKGGAGEVFRALDDKGNPVALKILHANAQDNPELHKRFQAEIKICSKLNHPHIVHLIDWGKQNDILYLAMELLEGESLGTRLRRDNKLSSADFLAVLMPLVSALQCLHDQGLVHRDLKPDNIFLRSKGGPALMDFGIAAGTDITRATQTGLAVGTPTFMAPEQVKGLFEPATDQYALGVLAFVCLTGRRPFEAEDAAAMAYQHALVAPPRPSSFNPDLPGGADSVILKMLSKHPSQRYPSVQEAARALQDALSAASFLDEATLATSS